MTPEERNTVIEALEIGRDAAAEVAARYHDAMAGYRKHVHDKMDDEVARLDAALAIMRGQGPCRHEWVNGGPMNNYKTFCAYCATAGN